MKLLQTFQQWLDGWGSQPNAQPSTGEAPAQEFAVRLARELDARLRQEVMTLPAGPILTPFGWIIFFSSAEDRLWRGLKRQALQQWLSRILLERVNALLPAGAPSQVVHLEIRLDPTLQAGEFKILPLWDLPSSPSVLGLPQPGRRS
jgi:hypothetical protein